MAAAPRKFARFARAFYSALSGQDPTLPGLKTIIRWAQNLTDAGNSDKSFDEEVDTFNLYARLQWPEDAEKGLIPKDFKFGKQPTFGPNAKDPKLAGLLTWQQVKEVMDMIRCGCKE